MHQWLSTDAYRAPAAPAPVPGKDGKDAAIADSPHAGTHGGAHGGVYARIGFEPLNGRPGG